MPPNYIEPDRGYYALLDNFGAGSPPPPWGSLMSDAQLDKCLHDDGQWFASDGTGEYPPNHWVVVHLFRVPDLSGGYIFQHERAPDDVDHQYWTRGIRVYNYFLGYWSGGGAGYNLWIEHQLHDPYHTWQYQDPNGDVWFAVDWTKPDPPNYLPGYICCTNCFRVAQGIYVNRENLSLCSNVFGQSAYLTTDPDHTFSLELAFEDWWGSNGPLDPTYPILGTDLHQGEIEFLPDGALQARYVDSFGIHHRAISPYDGEGTWIMDP